MKAVLAGKEEDVCKTIEIMVANQPDPKLWEVNQQPVATPSETK